VLVIVLFVKNYLIYIIFFFILLGLYCMLERGASKAGIAQLVEQLICNQ
jgi:hypothetical protein